MSGATEGHAGTALQRTSTLVAPTGRWVGRLGPDERMWLAVVVVWALTMFVMMQLVWPAIGEQHAEIQSWRIAPEAFEARVDAFIAENQVGEELGVPVVEPPPGDVWLLAQRYQFRPIVRLQRGERYRFMISASDVQHGFSLQPGNVNFQVLPGYITGIDLVAERDGTYTIVCNEYCGTGHHLMLGRVEVAGGEVAAAGDAAPREGGSR